MKRAFLKMDEFRKLDLHISNNRSKEERDEGKILFNCVKELQTLGYEAYHEKNKVYVNDKILNQEEINLLLHENETRQAPSHASQSSFETPTNTQMPTTQLTKRGRPKKGIKLKNQSVKRLEAYFPKDNESARKSLRYSKLTDNNLTEENDLPKKSYKDVAEDQ